MIKSGPIGFQIQWMPEVWVNGHYASVPEIEWLGALQDTPHPHIRTAPEPCNSYQMPQAELGFDGSRFGYILNPLKPNKYPP